MIKLPKRATTIFFKIVRNAISQKTRCINTKTNHDCAYRHGDKRCFAGWLISDEDYSPEFEGLNWLELVDYKYVSKCHSDLIYSIQQIHDGYHVGSGIPFIDHTITELRKIAHKLDCVKSFDKIVGSSQ